MPLPLLIVCVLQFSPLCGVQVIVRINSFANARRLQATTPCTGHVVG